MPHPHCLNCGRVLTGAERFCAQCGQRTDTARLSMRDVARDLMHSFVNVERGPLPFAWALLTRPGRVAREYVEGRRRRHYGPFATLVVIVGATALAINLTGYQVLARDGFGGGTTELLQRHFNVLQLAQLPLLGGCCALVFRSARLNLFEHMVLAAYTLGVRSTLPLVTALASALTAGSAAPSPGQVIAFWIGWFAYFGWAGSQFYGGHRLLTAARSAFAAVLAHATLLLLVIGGGRAWRVWFGG